MILRYIIMGEKMKRICIFSVVIVILIILSGCAAILSDFIVNKGTDYISQWSSKNIMFGANKDQILKHLGLPQSKDDEVWIYPIPDHSFAALKDSTVAVFFFRDKVITWLGYYGDQVTAISQPNYKTISIGDSQEKVIKDLGEPVYRGLNIWLFWKEPVIKYTFWTSPPVENTMQAIVMYEEKVIGILCFRSFEYYGKPYNLHLGMIIPPREDLDYAKVRLKQSDKK